MPTSSWLELIRKLHLRDRTEATIVVLIVVIGGTFFHPGQWNQNARLASIAAFVEPGTPYTGTFRIDGLMNSRRFYTDDWAQSRDGFYSNKAPGVALLGIVPYLLLFHFERAAGLDPTTLELTQINAFLLNLWISVFWNVVATLALVRRLPLLGLHSRESAVVVALVYSFATLVLPYGCSTWGHSTAAAFITLGTLDLMDGSPRRSVTAGWWFGMAVLTEYLAALTYGLAAILVLRRSDRFQRLERFVGGSAVPILTLLFYQKICFGSYFTPAPSLSNPIFFEPGRIAGLFGVPNPVNLLRMLLGGRGIFLQMPILLLSLFGAVNWYRAGQRTFLTFAATNIVLYALSISGMTGWNGGGTTSIRYMIIALPFFCMLLPGISTFRYRRTFVVFFAIAAANMFVLAATSTMYDGARPLVESAYPDFWRGYAAFNPVLAMAGLRGGVPAVVIAFTSAFGLGWLLRSAFVSRPSPTEGLQPCQLEARQA